MVGWPRINQGPSSARINSGWAVDHTVAGRQPNGPAVGRTQGDRSKAAAGVRHWPAGLPPGPAKAPGWIQAQHEGPGRNVTPVKFTRQRLGAPPRRGPQNRRAKKSMISAVFRRIVPRLAILG